MLRRVGTGSRWHSSGLVGAFKPTLAQVRLTQSSIRLLQDLESKGRPTGWKQCGSLLLARTRDRMTVYRRMKSQSVSWGIPCELVTPKKCQELWPLLNVDDVLGGLWIPGDGVGDPHLLCMALMKECIENVIRDPDGYIYLRERDGCILAGGFEPIAKPVYEEEITSMAQRCVPEDWDHFHVLLQQLLKRVPSLSQAVLHKLCNGLEAFSPDCKWIVGEAPEMFNYHVAAGMKTVGISAAGGVAEATADEIVDGYTKYDMYELGVHYGLPYPFHEFETGRNLRLSPIYPTLRDNGAVFGQVMGYERPTWFETLDPKDPPDKPRPFKVAYTKTFNKPHWFDTVQREYWACRERVGLADYSSFTKIDIQVHDDSADNTTNAVQGVDEAPPPSQRVSDPL
ncbi:hypothetical protein HF086_000616 [Spodoptera exigua]|uniref:Uncharacterized protein n=1 Tax=Spodoptera exigua TaxID=7107 RepID=A0A922MDV3_SPOEX|nr:hypothetical protein HF086_000616 [Spodoptera exigua]